MTFVLKGCVAKCVELLGLEGFKYPRICFRHFKKKDFLQTGKLKANTLPSQNLPPKSVKLKTEPQLFIKKEPMDMQPIKDEPMGIQPLESKKNLQSLNLQSLESEDKS